MIGVVIFGYQTPLRYEPDYAPLIAKYEPQILCAPVFPRLEVAVGPRRFRFRFRLAERRLCHRDLRLGPGRLAAQNVFVQLDDDLALLHGVTRLGAHELHNAAHLGLHGDGRVGLDRTDGHHHIRDSATCDGDGGWRSRG